MGSTVRLTRPETLSGIKGPASSLILLGLSKSIRRREFSLWFKADVLRYSFARVLYEKDKYEGACLWLPLKLLPACLHHSTETKQTVTVSNKHLTAFNHTINAV